MRTEMTGSALAPALLPASLNPAIRAVLLVAAGVGLLTLSAKIQVPFWPVPMTMATFMVLAIGAGYGAKLGVATIIAYIAAGMAGLPVFSGAGAGPAYMIGTTAGFIWGYIPAALIAGLAADRGWGRSPIRLGLAMLAGDAILFTMGFVWLAFIASVGGAAGVGVARAWAGGVEPFLLGDLVKVALAACFIAAGWAVFRRNGPTG